MRTSVEGDLDEEVTCVLLVTTYPFASHETAGYWLIFVLEPIENTRGFFCFIVVIKKETNL